MDKYSLVYIDDKPDIVLSKYLDKRLKEEFKIKYNDFEYNEIEFNPNEGYESLLINPSVKCANIIIIDSMLFENKTASKGKFKGEEFEVVLKKFFPFIEVIVITQKEISDDEQLFKIAKYNKDISEHGDSADNYYASILPKLIDMAISKIQKYRYLAELITENKTWDKELKEKVINSLNGINAYDELKEADIDRLIQAFKEIEEKIND